MRSRYAAFALRLGPYLARTLHPSHPDAAAPAKELARAIEGTAARFTYPELAVLEHEPGDGVARVLFFARVLEKGRDRSFVELSTFFDDGEGFQYASGELVPAAELADPRALRIATFEARLAARRR